MNSTIKINPHDFEYLTKSDQEYLSSIERLYLLNSDRLPHFRVLGPWHQVTSGQLNHIVDRVATPATRPCSKGHVKGLWCIEDVDYISGPKILKYQGEISELDQTTSSTSSEVSSVPSTTGKSAPTAKPTPPKTRKPVTPKNKYSIPRKYQVIPRPSPWIIMDPSKKKNFICDDPPDPSYRETRSAPARSGRGGVPRQSTAKSRLTVVSEDRYIASPYTRNSVSATELQSIVERVRKPTHASTGGRDLVEKYRNKDYVYGSRNVNPDINHISKPTVASNGGKDIAEKFDHKGYVYGSATVPPEVLDNIVGRITKPTVASTGGAGLERSYTDFVYGDQKVDNEGMKDIMDRITKPTVSSEGGKSLADKKWEYIKPQRVKTNIIIPGLDKKFIGRQKVSEEKMQEMIDRLTELTPAYKAKFEINPHVWKDESARTGPAHMREQDLIAT